MRWEGLLYYTIKLSLKKQSYESSLKKKKYCQKSWNQQKENEKTQFFFFFFKFMLVSFWGSGAM